MVDHTGSTAIERCPPEIWIMIFRLAIFVSKSMIHGLETDDSDSLLLLPMQKGEVLTASTYKRKQRLKAQRTAGRLSCVCRAWYDSIVPIASEWMLVSHLYRYECRRTMIMRHGEGLRAELIKSLHVVVDDPSKWDSQILAVATCHKLEEFHYQDQSGIDSHVQAMDGFSDFRQTVLQNCAQTLQRVIVEMSNHYLRMSDVIHFLSTAPRLERISFSALYIIEPGPDNGLDIRNCSELALRSFSWHAGDSADLLFEALAHFTLPHLTYMSLLYYQSRADNDDFDEDEDDYDADDDEDAVGLQRTVMLQSTPILPFFDSALKNYGANLKCLELKEDHWPSAPILDSVLRECPNLVTLGLAVGYTILPAHGLFHAKLQHLICLDSSFLWTGWDLHHDTDGCPRHGARVRKVIGAFCGASFPALRTVRIKNVQQCTPESQYWPRQQRFGPVLMDVFEKLVLDVEKLCKARKIRLTDCTGRSIDPKRFSPTYQWYDYRGEVNGEVSDESVYSDEPSTDSDNW